MPRTTKATPRSPERPATPQSQPSSTSNKPAHTIRYRTIKVTIWRNEGQTGPFYSATPSRSYQDEQKRWHDTSSFPANDLPMLAKAISDAHSWIAWQERKTKESASAKVSGGGS